MVTVGGDGMTTAHIYHLACEYDDDLPDDICPGCGQGIEGWEHFEAHYPPGTFMSVKATRMIPLPWTETRAQSFIRPCEWTHDFLTARAHRRNLIREGIT